MEKIAVILSFFAIVVFTGGGRYMIPVEGKLTEPTQTALRPISSLKLNSRIKI